MGYRVLRFDTSATVERQQLLNEGEGYSGIHVLQIPGEAAIELTIGAGERFPVFAGFAASFCPPESAGLTLRSTVAVPGEVIILAWFEGGVSGGPQ